MTALPGARAPIVVVHDALGHLGGNERVLEAILASHPDAELVAPYFGGGQPDGALTVPWPNPTTVAFTARRKRHALGPLYARRMARAPLGRVAVVVAVTHGGWSLGVRVPDGARLLVYLAGPPSALYEERHLYLPDYPLPLRPLFVAATPALRRANRRLVRRADRILTSSRWAAHEIGARYGRESDVLHPPVDTDFLTPDGRERRHVLVVARLVASKRVDVVIEAFRHRPERLVVAGCGPELERLRGLAPPNVEFAGHVTDAELRDLYRSSTALVCPSREEFGLVQAEALACGTPVVAPAEAGALEIVEPARTGLFLERVDAPSIVSALAELRGMRIDPEECHRSVLRFSRERFTAGFERVLAEELSLASALPRPRASVSAAAR
jgi:glycosyltransferase involved in cell wall biosynthesis